ncbi:MAG: hypothetical protein WCI88_14070 [Chloroflexota bacterium]|jgi:hypothetical protein
MSIQTMSLKEIRSAGLEVLARELGPVGMVRFLQQFETESGDYTRERYQWLGTETVETLAEKIKHFKEQTYTPPHAR